MFRSIDMYRRRSSASWFILSGNTVYFDIEWVKRVTRLVRIVGFADLIVSGIGLLLEQNRLHFTTVHRVGKYY